MKGRQEKTSDDYTGMKLEQLWTLATWIWEKSKPQIPPALRGSDRPSYCNHGCTEFNPFCHKCTNCTHLGWLLPGAGFAHCGRGNHQCKGQRFGHYSLGFLLSPTSSTLFHPDTNNPEDSATATSHLAACMHKHSRNYHVKPSTSGQRNEWSFSPHGE